LWIYFSNFLKQSLEKKTFIKYKFRNLWNSDLKRLTITTTVTKLLRFTWVMFNVTRMVFLHISSVLPKQSCLKCVYSLSHSPIKFLRLFGWLCVAVENFFLSASPVAFRNITPPRVHVVNSCHVCGKFHFQ